MITKNPFQEILNEKKLRQRDLAIVCDLSFSTVSNVVKGEYKILPEKVLTGVRKLGYEPKQIQKQYNEYRNALALEILKVANA